MQPLPVTIRGVSERGIVCAAQSCREDSPWSGGQEGDAVMMNPPTLAKWEFTFFATCGENCDESKVPRQHLWKPLYSELFFTSHKFDLNCSA